MLRLDSEGLDPLVPESIPPRELLLGEVRSPESVVMIMSCVPLDLDREVALDPTDGRMVACHVGLVGVVTIRRCLATHLLSKSSLDFFRGSVCQKVGEAEASPICELTPNG